MEDRIKCFIECALPTTVCNLKCSYCWVDQAKITRDKIDAFDFDVEYMVKALSVDRFGGKCLFSLCALGETLLQKDLTALVSGLLKNGHYVNLTTNGTISAKFYEICEVCKENISHLHFSFSFHYVELKKKNLLNTFFDNIDLVRRAGASFLLQINLVDEYIPYIEEIKKLSIERTGALPQVALTRDQTSSMKIFSNLKDEDYFRIGEQFNSQLFDFTYKNFNLKCNNYFCYAGAWSFTLNMKTGLLKQCYGNNKNNQNIFINYKSRIKRKPVGYECFSPYCVNSSHFKALGVIPSIDTPSYADLRNRHTGLGDWMTEEFYKFTNGKLAKSNKRRYLAKRIFPPMLEKIHYKLRNLRKK